MNLNNDKMKNWNFAININQLDGEYKPSKELKEFIEKEVEGKVSVDEIVKALVEKYREK